MRTVFCALSGSPSPKPEDVFQFLLERVRQAVPAASDAASSEEARASYDRALATCRVLLCAVRALPRPPEVAAPDGSELPDPVAHEIDELERRADEVAGRFVLFNRAMPRILRSTFMAYGQAVPQRTSGASRAAGLGAVGALVRSMTTRLDDVPHTGTMIYADGVERIPAAALSTVDADTVAGRVAAGDPVRVRLAMSCEPMPDAESANVVGELVGRERPDEVIVIGGHLDAWDVGQGAHDDGAGCVHAIEAVRLLQEIGYRPRRTLRVVLFTNEESGLRGARAYAAEHADETHVAAIESDRGGFVPRGFTTSARGEVLRRLEPWVDVLDDEQMGALIRGGGGADIGPLAEHGAVLFGLATIAHRYFDYHHSARDRIDAVNERELALGAAACAWLLTVLDRADLRESAGTR